MAGRGQVILRLGKNQGPAVVFGLIVRAEDGDCRSGIHETDSRPLVFRYVPLCLRRHFGGWGFHSRPGGSWPTINASDSGRGSCRRPPPRKTPGSQSPLQLHARSGCAAGRCRIGRPGYPGDGRRQPRRGRADRRILRPARSPCSRLAEEPRTFRGSGECGG